MRRSAAIVRAGISKGYRMMGIQRGYNGLINGECYEMNVRSVSEIIHRGGTILLHRPAAWSSRTAAGQAKALARCKELGIDALIVIGGDGSFMGARALANQGIPCVGIPGTIDNDIACSEYTIGYDTAMNTAVEAIDKLRDTTQSHDRCRRRGGHGPPCRLHRPERGHRHRRAGGASAGASL